MNDMNEMEQARLDDAQWVTLATIFDCCTEPHDALEMAKFVQKQGGIELFDAEWSCELWRRAQAAINDSVPPSRYILVKQVEPIPMEIISRLGDNALPVDFVQNEYLPRLILAANKRKMIRAMKKAIEGGSIEEALETCKNAQTVSIPQKTKSEICNEALKEWEKAAEHPGEISGVTTGLPDLDHLTWGWQPENLVIIGARPSHGKTALLIGLARAAAFEKNVPTLFITLESSPKELLKRLACQIGRVSQARLRGGYAIEQDLKSLVPSFIQIHKKPIWFSDCSGMSITTIQNATRRIVKNFGIKLILVDYLQKIRPAERHEKRTYEVAQASEGLKILAKELGIPVIAAAQLNREPEKQKGRAPVLSDLADSGQIERDADIVLLLHKKPESTWLTIAKFRDGPVGAVELKFDRECARFDNMSKNRDEPNPPYKDT